MVLLEAHVDQFDGFGGYVDADPLAVELVGGDAGGGAAAEGVEDSISSGLLEEDDRLLPKARYIP